MRKAFQVNDSPREGTSEALALTPPVSIVWRMMRLQLDRLNKERQNQTDELETLKKAMVPIANEEYRLRKVIRTGAFSEDAANWQQLADRLKLALADTGVVIVAPEGEIYTSEYMDVIENIAQEPRDELEHPVVLEVMSPAILYRDELLRAGKAVIGVPRVVQRGEPENKSSPQE